MGKVVGFIPIKLNNQRLPGKNIMKLGDKALCEYLFSTVRKVRSIDEVYVYCSDNAIREYIPDGINFLKRPTSLDSDDTKSKDIIEAFINSIEADVYVLMHVTQPFIKKKSIEASIEKVISGNYDSAFTAHEIREFTWYKGEPLNYSFSNVVRTQQLEPIYTEGELYIFRKEVFVNMGRRIGKKPYIHPISWIENVCIDTIDDFRLAEAVVAIDSQIGDK